MKPAILFALGAILMSHAGWCAETPATKPAAAAVRIALLGDPHVSNNPSFALHLSHFATIIDQVNEAHVDAVLIAGDLTQSGDADSERSFKLLTARFQAPCWYVAGNHDIGQRALASGKTTVSAARLEQFQTLVGLVWFDAEIVPRIHLVGISSSLFGTGLPQEKEQWDFLEKQLHAPSEGLTVVLSHYPLYAGSPEEPDGYFNLDPASRTHLGTLLHESPHALMLSAHLHRPIQHEWKDVKDIGAPAISFGLPRATQRVGWCLITLNEHLAPAVELHYLRFDPAPASKPAHSPATSSSPLPSATSTPTR